MRKIPVELGMSAEPDELWLEVTFPDGKRLRLALPLETVKEAVEGAKPSTHHWSWAADVLEMKDG